MALRPAQHQMAGGTTADTMVLVGTGIMVTLGVTAYGSGVLSGLVAHGRPAHAAVMPVIGWTFVGLATFIHGADPARAWPPDSGCGPAGMLWAIFFFLVTAEFLAARKLPFIRRAYSKWTQSLPGARATRESDRGLSAGEAKRHNERLGL